MSAPARIGGSLVVAACVSMLGSPAAVSQDDDAKTCLGAQPQHGPLDGLTANFNSVKQTVDKEATRVVDCVEIAGASHEYYVDWPDTNVRDTFTKSGRATGAETFSEDLTILPSSLYLGANRSEFQAGNYREATMQEALSGVVKSWISRFKGSVSTVSRDRPISERQERLQEVDLEVRLDIDGSVARFTVADRAADPHGLLRFVTPREVRNANGEAPPDAPLGKETVITYPVDREAAVIRHVPFVLLNADRQVVGSIPAAVADNEPR